MEDNVSNEVSLDLTLRPDSMNVNTPDLLQLMQNLQISNSSQDNEMANMQTSHYYKYNSLARYLVLKSTSRSDISRELLSELNKIGLSEYFVINDVMCKLSNFFRHDFDKILGSIGEQLYAYDLECVALIISRCVILIGDPSYYSFLLVAAFLERVVTDGIFEMQCFRILPFCELCFDILYNRYFQKIFISVETYVNLYGFCRTFRQYIQDSRMGETPVGKIYMDLIKKCVEVTDASFSLTDSEKEMFSEICYLDVSRTVDTRRLSGKMSKGINSYIDTSNDNKVIVCEVCYSRCYCYIDIIEDFVD